MPFIKGKRKTLASATNKDSEASVEASKNSKKEESATDDLDIIQTTLEASKSVQELLALDESETKILLSELQQLEEDPVLVCKANPAWIANHTQAAADAVFDAIATWRMGAVLRRDAQEGCHRWIFHFQNSSDISQCLTAMRIARPLAFGVLPHVAARIGGNGILGLAECVVIHKVAAKNDDVQFFPFFYS
jgi:hypothetical protein